MIKTKAEVTKIEVETCRVVNSIQLTKLEIDQSEKRRRDTAETKAIRERVKSKKEEIKSLIEDAR